LVSEVVAGSDAMIDASGPLSNCPICAHPLVESLHREGHIWCCDTGHMFGSLGALLAAMTRAMFAVPPPRRVGAARESAPQVRTRAPDGVALPNRPAAGRELLSA
jgi:hypothetical protein